MRTRSARAASGLHDWIVPLAAWRQSHGHQGGDVNESARIVEESRENIGAGVMGRNMFGPVGGGPWGDEQWTGWWGDDPPYHYPVCILTHYQRDPVEMKGGTTFHFVTDGIESTVLVSSTTSGTRRCSSSRSGPSRRPASPTSRQGGDMKRIATRPRIAHSE
jgi:dihydrofolate reductase